MFNRPGTIGQQSLVWFFISGWHNCSTVTGTIVQQSLAQLFNSHWHNCSTVTGTIVQQTLVRLIKSHRHDFSLVAGTAVQQSLARLFNSGGRHGCSTVTGKIFFLCWQNSLTVKITVKELCHVPGIQRIVPCARNTTHDPILVDHCPCRLCKTYIAQLGFIWSAYLDLFIAESGYILVTIVYLQYDVIMML